MTAITQVACKYFTVAAATTGLLDLTIPDLGFTPDACMVYGSIADISAPIDSVPGIAISQGMTDNGSAYCVFQYEDDAQSSPNPKSEIELEFVCKIVSGANSKSFAVFTGGAVNIANGWKFDVINAGSGMDVGLLIVYFKGTDIVLTAAADSNTSGAPSNNFGFVPNLTFWMSPHSIFAATDDISFSSGVSFYNGTIVENYSTSIFALKTVSTSSTANYVSSEDCLQRIDEGAVVWGSKVTSYAPDPNNVIKTGNGGNVTVVGFHMNTSLQFKAGIVDAPNDDSVAWSQTPLGFKPDVLALHMSHITNVDTHTQGTPKTATIGWSLTDFVNPDSGIVAGSTEDGQGTSDVESLSDNKFINSIDGSGVQRYELVNPIATDSGWDVTDDNNILNPTYVSKWMYWAFGPPLPAPPPTDIIETKNVREYKPATRYRRARHIEERIVAFYDHPIFNSASIDSLNLQDVSNSDVNLLSSSVDSFTLQDSNLSGININTSNVDSFAFQDLSSANFVNFSVSVDSFSFQDSNSSIISKDSVSTDSFSVQDSNLSDVNLLSSNTDSLLFQDSSLSNVNIDMASVDSLLFQDSSLSNVNIDMASVDSFVFQDLSLAGLLKSSISNDSISFQDSSIGFVTAGVHFRVSVDSMSVQDSSSSEIISNSVSLDSLSLQDSSLSNMNANMASVDSMVAQDSSLSNINVDASNVDSFSLQDFSSPITIRDSFSSDSFVFQDSSISFITAGVFFRVSADSVSIQDSSSSEVVFNSVLSDSLSLQDSAIAQLSILMSSVDSFLFSDSSLNNIVIDVLPLDSLFFQDSSSSNFLFQSSSIDSIIFQDFSVRLVSKDSLSNDSISLQDSSVVLFNPSSVSLDSINFQDSSNNILSAVNASTDLIAFADSVSAISILDSNAFDIFALQDSANNIAEVFSISTDSIFVTDISQGILNLFPAKRTINVNAVLTDSLSFTASRADDLALNSIRSGNIAMNGQLLDV